MSGLRRNFFRFIVILNRPFGVTKFFKSEATPAVGKTIIWI